MADTSVLASIEDFVDRTKVLLETMRSASELGSAALAPISITDSLASEVIRACFYASLISDEGRWPKSGAARRRSCGFNETHCKL